MIETEEIKTIKNVVCEAFFIEESELSISGKTKCSVKMAQYAFSHYAYEKTMNKHNLMRLVGVSKESHFDKFIRKHSDNLCNSQYRKICDKIENKLK